LLRHPKKLKPFLDEMNFKQKGLATRKGDMSGYDGFKQNPKKFLKSHQKK